MSKMTKKALANSLKRLMERKSLSKITVTDITEECGINRHTFYYHFRDIFDLVEWIYLTEAEEAITDQGSPETWEEGLWRLFNYGRENKRFVLGTYESFQKDHLQKFTYKHTEILIEKVVMTDIGEGRLPEKSYEFLVSFYTHAFAGIIIDWVENSMKDDPEDLIRMLSAVLYATGKGAIGQFLTT